MMTLFRFSCFLPSPLVIKTTPDTRVKTSSEQLASADSTQTSAQEQPHTALHRKKIRFGNYKLNIEIPGTANCKPVIEYIPLGGTISAEGTEHAYTAGKKSGKELLGTAHIPHNVRITVEDNPPFTMDSKDLSLKDLLVLRGTIMQKLQTADSIVLTHGSDTMAITAFFLHLTIPKEMMEGKKIIFAGSMKPANFKKPDGPTNLSNALRLAKKADVSGIMAVMNATGEVFSPPYFEKRHTDAIAAFKAVNGNLAAQIKHIPVVDKHVVNIKNGPTIPVRTFDIGDDIQNLLNAPVISSQVTGDQSMIIVDIKNKAMMDNTCAIVFAATGNGTIHKDIEAAIPEIIAETGIPIIRATKVGDGEVTRNDTFNDDEHGTLCAGKLVPDLAAVLAQVAIAQALNQDEEIKGIREKLLNENGENEKKDLKRDLNNAFRRMLGPVLDNYQTPKMTDEPAMQA